MRILGAIQARLGSTRLPGKVLLPLLGKTMLFHLVERVKRAKVLDDLAVICPLKDFVEISRAVSCKTLADRDIEESDLVTRYWGAAVAFGADAVVRICSDDPCIDPANIDRLVNLFIRVPPPEKTLMTNAGDIEKSIWPQGLGAEIYSRELLQDMCKILRPGFREHPHKTFHPTGMVIEPECPYYWTPPLRYDVNTQDDFNRIERIYKHFGNNTFTTQELLNEQGRYS